MRPNPLPLLLSAACTAAPTDSADPAGACSDSLPVGEVVPLADGFTRTEGISFSPEGRLFVTAGDVVAEIQPDGSWSAIAALSAGVGLAWWGERLIAAGYPDGVGSVVSIDVDSGATTVLTDTIEAPNFLTVTPWGSLLVADAGEQIWEVQPDGTTTAWLALPGPNGMAFTLDEQHLWVVNTWDSPAPLWRVPVENQAAGAPVEILSYEASNFPDGVALGASGTLYVSLNLTGLISAVAADGSEHILAEGANFTASLAFGTGENWDPCALYSTSLFSSEVFAIGVGEVGHPPIR